MLPNVVITPHVAYYSEESITKVRDFAAHEVVRVLTGKPPLSPVNADQFAARGLEVGPPERPSGNPLLTDSIADSQRPRGSCTSYGPASRPS